MQQVLNKYMADLKKIGAVYEIVAVNDGCSDGSEDILNSYAKTNRNFRVVTLDGRYGKQAAITAGMDGSDPKSEIVIVADVDLLNPIGILEQIVDRMNGGSEIVYAKRERNGFSKFKSHVSDRIVRISTWIFGVDGLYTGKTNITAFSRSVADVIIAVPERNKFLRTMDTWTGWKIDYMIYTSGYSKIEEKNVVIAAENSIKKSPMVKSRKPLERDNIREHSASLDVMWGCMFGALGLMILGIVFETVVSVQYWITLIVWLMFAMLVLISKIYYLRAVLIKRVGIVRPLSIAKLYEIKDIKN